MNRLFWVFGLVLAVADDISAKYIKVESLDALSHDQHHEIFQPISQSTTNGVKHDIHVEDIFGKFMKLRYEATHPDNTKIFKLDDIKSDIISVVCQQDEINTIEVEFAAIQTAELYYSDINKYIETKGEYYISGSYRWMCKDKNTNQYAPLIRHITSIELDASLQMIIFTTDYAAYTDLFQTLDLQFVTNAKMFHSPSSDDTIISTKQINNRRRLSWFSDIWDDITAGVKTVITHIESWIDDITTVVGDLWDGVEDVIDVIQGKTVTRNLTDNYFWSYNYDSDTDTSTESFYLDSDDNVNCVSCYVWFDLEYTFKIKIEDRSLKYLYLVGEGDAKMFAEIELKSKMDLEYDLDTPKVPIPYLSIGVAGIEFGFVVYGALGIGVQIEIDYIWFEYTAQGTIKRGIEYDGDTNTQNYIGEHSFSYDKQGPKLEFNSMNITFYLKPTIYLALNYIGAVYFGVQPELEFTFTKDVDYYDTSDSSACAIDYVPTAKLLVFIGAEIKPLNLVTVWSKEPSLEVAHAVLTSLEGCITQATLSTLETYLGDSSRRRLADSDVGTDKNCYVDYTNSNVRNQDRYYQWGSRTSQWWGNKTELDGLCTDNGQLTDADNIWPITMPKDGNLLIRVKDNKGGKRMVGIYKTTNIELYMSDGWGITTNVTCLSRLEFERSDNYNDYKGIDSYDVKLLEWYCDLNMSMIGMKEGSALETAWIDMISLPSTMNAIVLDSSFSNIMLFDDEWCKVFVLGKQQRYQIDAEQIVAIDWSDLEYEYPSQQWFGSYHCLGDNVVSISLYFESIDWNNGTLTAWLMEDDKKQLVTGKLNYNDFSMILSNDDDSLVFMGIITLLQDGTILYSGSVDDNNCTGFVFQGYVNTEPLEYAASVNNNEEDDTSLNTESPSSSDSDSGSPTQNSMLIGVFIGIGICLVLFVIGFLVSRAFGYSCNKKENGIVTSYNLMNEVNQEL